MCYRVVVHSSSVEDIGETELSDLETVHDVISGCKYSIHIMPTGPDGSKGERFVASDR